MTYLASDSLENGKVSWLRKNTRVDPIGIRITVETQITTKICGTIVNAAASFRCVVSLEAET